MKIHAYYNFQLGSEEFLHEFSIICQEIEHHHLISLTSIEKSKYVKGILQTKLNHFEWKNEFKPSSSFNDTIDVIGTNDKKVFIIEIDNMRADQVTKKMFSRIMIYPEETDITYVSLLYSTKGNRNGDRDECIKYVNTHFKTFFERNKTIKYLALIPQF